MEYVILDNASQDIKGLQVREGVLVMGQDQVIAGARHRGNDMVDVLQDSKVVVG